MILFSEELGWKKKITQNKIIYFSGYFINDSEDEILKKIIYIIDNYGPKSNELIKYVNNLNGNFGIIFSFKKNFIAITDRINSKKIYYFQKNNHFIISNNPNLIIKNQIFKKYYSYNYDAILEIAMSGYAIDNETIINNLFKLRQSEIFFFDKEIYRLNYFKFNNQPLYRSKSLTFLRKKFNEILLNNIENIVSRSDSREIVLSISAGKDSRLLSAAFKKIGYKNLKLLSYGHPNAFESRTGKKIAEKLDYQFVQIPITIKSQKDFFRSTVFNEYKEKTNTFSSMTFLQDISSFYYAKKSNLIHKDSIIVNGNGGDFLSGGHLINVNNYKNTIKSFIDKHYTLWKVLRNDKNDKKILNKLSLQLNYYQNYKEINKNEYSYILEFLNRQCNYVINMQHSYDFLKLDWRVPLWDNNIIDFWLSVDQTLKINQNLYNQIIFSNNWSNLFSTIDINNPKSEIFPRWLIPLRNLSKLFFIFLGKDKWRQYHQNVFWYFLDDAKNMALNPYLKVLFDLRGQRNDFSWIAEDYLQSLGIKNFIK